MEKVDRILSDGAPAPVGPYVQAVAYGGILYCSGSLPVNVDSGRIEVLEPAGQTRVCLANLAAVCAAAGTGLHRILRATIYTTDLSAFPAINAVYAEFFEAEFPARTTVEVAALPLGAAVEIDAIVAIR